MHDTKIEEMQSLQVNESLTHLIQGVHCPISSDHAVLTFVLFKHSSDASYDACSLSLNVPGIAGA